MSISKRVIVALLFLIYMIAMIWVLLISVDTTNRNTYFIKTEIHLIPFYNTYLTFQDLKTNTNNFSNLQIEYYIYLCIRNILGNILLFIPFGFLLPLLIKKLTLRNTFLTAFSVSLSFEIIQYVFTLGVSDIDDVVYNTFGALIGFYFSQFLNPPKISGFS